ncbi:hypothetical protein M0R45_000513 [Rubus argutus]|uniref:Uncharacterized protein n=1 Tax=Rubus argutus TaxID=59490 RepID=A0AAW1VS19_RUBAR
MAEAVAGHADVRSGEAHGGFTASVCSGGIDWVFSVEWEIDFDDSGHRGARLKLRENGSTGFVQLVMSAIEIAEKVRWDGLMSCCQPSLRRRESAEQVRPSGSTGWSCPEID